jgi:hypothetical protein
VEILQLPALTSLLFGEYPATELSHSPTTSLHFTSLSRPGVLASSLYSLRVDPKENIPVSILTVLCASRFRGIMFTEPLPSNACSFSRSLHSNSTTFYTIVLKFLHTLYFGRKRQIIHNGFPQHSCFSAKKADNRKNFAAGGNINPRTHHNSVCRDKNKH